MNIRLFDKRWRVLIVDDNPSIHDDFRKILCLDTSKTAALDATEEAVYGRPMKKVQQTHFNIESAYQGQEAVQLVKTSLEERQPFAMAFVDVRMPPGWDGVETTRKILEIDPDMQIVICTAYSDYSWGEIFEKLGNRDGLLILKKPFDAVEALQLAHALTEKWWLSRQSRQKTEELENLVAERTHELQQSNQMLQAEVADHRRAELTANRLAAIVESSGVAVIGKDLKGIVTSWNNGAKQIFGYTASEMVGSSIMRLIPVGRPDQEIEISSNIRLSEGAQHFETLRQTKDGRLVDVSVTASPIKDATGKVMGLSDVAVDITERKKAEESLRASQNSMATAQRIAHLGSWELDLTYTNDIDANTLHWSDEMFRIVGYEPGTVAISRDFFFRVVPEIDHEPIRQAVAAAIRERRTYSIVHQLIRADGEVRVVHEEAQIFYDEKTGKPLKIVGTAHDITERKRSDESLQLLSSAVDQAKESIMITDAELDVPGPRIIFVNPAFTKMTGFTREEALGKTPRILQGPHTDKSVLSRLRQTLERGEVFEGEVINYRQNGEEFILEWQIAPIRNSSGKITHFVSIQRDITERKRAEEALRESEERFSSAFEQAPIGLALISPDGRWLKVNRAICDLVGYSESELLTRTFKDITHPEDIDVDLENVRRMIAGEITSYQMEKRYIHQSGRFVTVLLSVSLVRDGQGHPRYFISQIQDITERKQAEETLNASQQIIEGIINAIPVRVFWKDKNFVYLGCNAAFASDAGFADPKEIIGKDDYQMGWRDQADMYRAADLQIIGSGCSKLFIEEPQTTPEGKTATLLTSKIPLRNSKGEISGVLGTYMDITERKWLEARFFQSQKMETVGKLAGGVAHEFNSIMTAIIGHSELMLNEILPSNSLHLNVTEIRKAAERAATLTRQLLAYGRKQILEPVILDLNSVLVSMESTLHHLMGRGVDVCMVLAKGHTVVKADAGQIEHVIMNIAMNAADAMTNGGKLTLETGIVTLDQDYVRRYSDLKAGEYVMLAITDTGKGMSEEVKARIFEPFFTTKAVGEGTGLGLSTCYGILKQSGGHISVYSERGRGATFKVYLPQVARQMTVPIQRLTSPGLPRGTETILLVEDDPALREMAALLLKQLGYTVLVAANGIEALSLKQESASVNIDLLFTDLDMPHMNGKEICKHVLSLYPKTKILFTSACTKNALLHQGMLVIGEAFLEKPFTPVEMARNIREVLDVGVARNASLANAVAPGASIDAQL